MQSPARLLFPAIASLALLACDNPVSAPEESPATVSLNTNTQTGDPQGEMSEVFPSTNDINYSMTPDKWAHVLFVDVGVEQVTLNFVSERNFVSCFEYRLDDGPPTGAPNPNTEITDGLWLFTCVNNSSTELTFSAHEYVDVRMGFGAEGDERFDWTRFYVLSLDNKDQCKAGEWEALGFRNQGQCVRYVETGKDSRTGG